MVKSSTKVWIFILSTSLFMLILGYNIGDRLGLFICFILAIFLNALVFWYGENHLLTKMKARPLKGQDPWGANDLARLMSLELGLPPPAIYAIPHDSISAFCVAHAWKRGSLCLTQGLLQNLSRLEMEAVIAHQICQIRRLDTFSFGVSSTLANAVVGIGQVLDSLLPTNFLAKRKQRPFLNLFSPLGWLIIKAATGERAFFENDLMASQLIEDRVRIGQLLWRLEGLAQTHPMPVPPCTSHLFIVNPEGFGQKNMFLKSHPSIEKRLQKLLGYYPV